MTPRHAHSFVDVHDRASWPIAPTPRYLPPAGAVDFVLAMRHPAFGWTGQSRFCTECGLLDIRMFPPVLLR